MLISSVVIFVFTRLTLSPVPLASKSGGHDPSAPMAVPSAAPDYNSTVFPIRYHPSKLSIHACSEYRPTWVNKMYQVLQYSVRKPKNKHKLDRVQKFCRRRTRNVAASRGIVQSVHSRAAEHSVHRTSDHYSHQIDLSTVFRSSSMNSSVMSETVGLRTRPVWDQKIGSWSWSCRSGVVLWNTVLLRSSS